MVLYRELKGEDIPSLNQMLLENEVDNKCYEPFFRHAMVLLIDQQIRGFIAARIDSGEYYLQIVLIDRAFRGKQYGDGMIKSFLNMADLRGITRVYANSDAAPLSLFKHLNFRGDEQTVYADLPAYFESACKHE